MKYRVVHVQSDEGIAVGCPALPGCWSQGDTREEALDNIRDAIREYLEVKEEDELRAAAEDGARAEICDVELTSA